MLKEFTYKRNHYVHGFSRQNRTMIVVSADRQIIFMFNHKCFFIQHANFLLSKVTTD